MVEENTKKAEAEIAQESSSKRAGDELEQENAKKLPVNSLMLLMFVNAAKVDTYCEGFEQIVDFLNANPINYALTVNPTIYTSCIEQFWATVKAKTINGEVQLQALVDGKKIVITESTVRRDLQLEDAEGTDCLHNATIFEQLTLMGYKKLSQKLTFYKAFFSPQWKFRIHTILQCLSAKTTTWNEFSSTMASAIICLATNQKFNFSKYIFESMVKNLDNIKKKWVKVQQILLIPMESGQPLQSSLTSVHGGHQPSTNIGGNLPPNGTLLSHHAQSFIPSSLYTPTGLAPIHVNPYSQSSAGIVNRQPSNFPFQTQISNPPAGSMYLVVTPLSNYPFYTQPMYAPPNMPMYPNLNPNPAGSFTDATGSVTPFVHWIEDYPLPDGLKMPSHIGSYDGKGDPDNFLHLFEGSIRMQKWLMPVACHMFTYTLKDSARIWWSSQKAGSILNYKDLKGQKRRDRFSPYRGPNHGLLSSLSKSPREILATEKAARSFEQPPRMLGSRRSRDMSKYCHFYEDHGHDTNEYRQLRNHIEEAVKSGQLSHLVKGIKKERVKAFENQRVEGKKDKGIAPAEAPILMIRQDESYTKNNALESFTSEGRQITFPSRGSNSSTPVVIKAKIFGREVSRVHMDSESSCEGNNPGLSNLPYNMLLGRTTMQKMRIVVSIIHGAIKFHTTKGIGTVFLKYKSDKVKEGMKKVRETPPASKKGVFSCAVAEEKVVVNNKYPEQTITIGKQLSEHFKRRLRDLLRANADVFA
ncbi:hypothetical protein Tco_1056449 [Tanacetum coccineum]|uniref:Reverse transcriptase domain-containing protein n=1 Tax=Tanacetum coccineum TaxID=301880 RepID=A0ABQ5H4A2_9ASTR